MIVVWAVNKYHAGRREQTTGQTFHKMFINIEFLEFGDYIWNQHEKCIQISTNKPGIGAIIREIGIKIQKCEKSKNTFAQLNQCLRSKC